MNKEVIYHFVGIKGSGMSALALVLHGEGYQVQGSDVEEYIFTQDGVEQANIPILLPNPDNIKPGMVVICGNAFKDDNEEVVRAKELNVPVIRYHHFLGELIKKYKSIAITGSHGKTSTTGLLSQVLGHNRSTSYLIGDGTGKGIKDSEYFVLEADEYREHFLAYNPDYAIFTNIDFDHPDFYKNIEEVYQANKQFALQVKRKVIAYGKDPFLQRFVNEGIDVLYYGLDDKFDIVAKNVKRETKGSRFDVYVHGEFYGQFSIHLFGEHNILNSLAVIAFCYLVGLSSEAVQEALSQFQGVKRRFNEQKIKDMVVVDDYAHHPSEIRATIDAARQEYPDKEVVAVFQPHTYSRTRALLDQFVSALDLADCAYLCPIFPSAREKDDHTVSSQDIVDRLSVPSVLIEEENMNLLLKHHDAVILFMGAGDVMKKYGHVYEELLEEADRNYIK